MQQPILEAKSLVKKFGALCATNNVSLELMPGEILGLIGPNGAGKTTLIQLLSGSIQPDSGSLYIDGKDVTNKPAHERVSCGMARSFQVTNVFPELSVLENLTLALQACSGSSFRFWQSRDNDSHLKERAYDLASKCSINGNHMSNKAASLPHGEQRKLEFALTLASEPRVLLLDEPMAGMGPDETVRLTEFIESLRGKYGILLVEHDMDAVFKLADRVAVLVSGQIVACGSVSDIRSDKRVIEAYLGELQP